MNIFQHALKEFYNRYGGDALLLYGLGKIGGFGPLSFRVNPNSIVSPSNGVSISKSSSYKKHSILGATPIAEYSYRNLRKISLEIVLLQQYSSIDTIVDEITRMVENGEHYPLFLGGKEMSEHDFYIESVSETIQYTTSSGKTIVCIIKLSFEEYIENIDRDILPSPPVTQNTKKVSKRDVKKNNKKHKNKLKKKKIGGKYV